VKNLAVARRYAKALLLIGKDDGQAELYREELDNIAGLVTGEKELEQAITNPLYDAAGRRKVLHTIIDKLTLSDMMKSFLLLVFDKGRIGFLCNIDEFYKKLADELKGIARASLVSATELSLKSPPQNFMTNSDCNIIKLFLQRCSDTFRILCDFLTHLGKIRLSLLIYFFDYHFFFISSCLH